MDIERLLQDKFSARKPGSIVLLDLAYDHYALVKNEAVRLLKPLDYQGVYATLNYPTVDLVKKFDEEKIDYSNLYFVDAVTQMFGAKKVAEKVDYIFGPLSLDELTTAIYKRINELKSGSRFVLIDSITTVMLYNGMPCTLSFINRLSDTLKKRKIMTMILSISKGPMNEALLNELRSFCDLAIKIP
jgi:archaellum biogenesis ATPase FlaH